MIPLVDLKTQYQTIKHEVQEAILRVLDANDYILGKEVAAFEKEFAAFCSSPFAVGCGNGTDALILALKALGIQDGDEVITVSNTWASTAFAISATYAKPVFVDIDPKTYLIDPNKIESAISSKTKAILPVHLYGQTAPMDKIKEVADNHNIYLVEDAAQAHGALWKKMPVGALSDIACFSFYPGKNLGSYGDGGAITTSNPDIDRKIKMLRNIGQEKKHIHEVIGLNSRLDTVQAAVLNVKLRYLNSWNQKRREAAARYDTLLKNLDCVTPYVHPDSYQVNHLYVIQVNNRDKILESLHGDGVMAQIHYPTPLHLQPCYKDLDYQKGSLPITEEISSKILSLPIFPEITPEQQELVVEALKKAL